LEGGVLAYKGYAILAELLAAVMPCFEVAAEIAGSHLGASSDDWESREHAADLNFGFGCIEG